MLKTRLLFLLLLIACSETFGVSIHQEQDHVSTAALADLGGPLEPKGLWKGKQILLSNVTEQIVDRRWNENNRQTLSTVTPLADTRTDFALRAKTACAIKRRFKALVPYKLISIKNGKKNSNQGEQWDNFDQKYPNAYGYLSFSRPGYNSSHSEALLYVEHACAGLCGSGHLYFLQKQKGHWRVVNKQLFWIS